ncbi:MAG: amidohydrolase family protein [Solirubrobacteraceae bacterium]
MSTLIKDATVIAMDGERGEEARHADILVEGDRIAAVGPGLETDGVEVIDARRRLVIPGLVNSHFHSNQNFLRGRYPGRPLESLMLYAYPFDPALAPSPELVYLRTLIVAIEALRNGVTCLLDDCIELPSQDHEQLAAVFRAYEDAGIRANCSGHVINKQFMDTLPYARQFLSDELLALFGSAPPPSTEHYLEFATEAVRRFHDATGRLRYVIAPSGPQRCTDDLLAAAAEFAERHGTAYHMHVLETKVQQVTGRELYGKSLVAHLHEIGALSRRLTMAHAIWISDEDIELMAAADCSVAHNPVCNLRIGSGIAPLRKLLSAGVNVALGTDEIDCNDSGRIFDVMKAAGIIHTMSDFDYDHWPTAGEILRAATLGGARSVCLEHDVGSLEVGKKADITLLDLDAWPFVPTTDPRVSLVYAENGSSVTDVIVNGEIVVRDRALTRLDEAAVMAEVRGRMPEILEQRARWEEIARHHEPEMKALYMHCMAEETGLNRLAGPGAAITV